MNKIKEEYLECFLLNMPIKFYNVCNIYQYTMEEIYNYGKQKYEKLLLPFSITTDLLNLSEAIYNTTENFDLLFYKDENGKFLFSDVDEVTEIKTSFLDILIDAISLFCNCDKKDIKFDSQNFGFIIGDNTEELNRDNFDEFANIILNMHLRERYKPKKVEVKKENTNRYNKYMEERKKHGKDEFNFADIINLAIHGGKSFIPYYEIKKMTIWQIYNTYKTISQIDQSNKYFEQYISGTFDTEKMTNPKHWSETIKL